MRGIKIHSLIFLIAILFLGSCRSARTGINCETDYNTRSEIVQNEKPYSYICHLYVNRGRRVYPSTGFLLANNTIATSGHSIGEPRKWYGFKNKVQSVKIVLFEYYENQNTYKALTTVNLPASELESYGSHPNYRNLNTRIHDFGYLKLKTDTIHQYADGHFELALFDSLGTDIDYVSITGYPSDKQRLKQGSLWTKGDTKGNIHATSNFLTYGIPTKTGDSGSPVWIKKGDDYYVIGIHNTGYKYCNGGTKVTKDVLQYYDSVMRKAGSNKFLPFNKQQVEPEKIKLYRVLNQDLNIAKPISFLTAPAFKNLENSNLTKEEGKEGFIVDSQFFIKFPVLEKRYFENESDKNEWIKPFFGYSRLYIDYGFSSRVARGVKSSPSLPITNRYGIRWDKVLTFRHKNSLGGNDWHAVNVLGTRKRIPTYDLVSKEVKYQFIYFSAYLHHYSNGGYEGVFISPNRNDYVNGDHSTSFWRGSVGLQYHNGTKSHFAGELGLQHELGNQDSFFSFPEEQENRYGRNRLVANIQYIKNFNKFIFEYLKVRTDLTFILDGDLSNYPFENQYRFGSHVFIDAPFRFSPGLGLLSHFYIGRDYLNIRYDNPVITAQIGLSLAINRYSLNIFERPTPSK